MTDCYRIALVSPASGVGGIFGPSCDLSTRLAMREINDRGGILGREVHLQRVDAGRDAHELAVELERRVREGEIHAIVGWHRSDVRRAIAHRVEGQVPYIYTAVYEGGEYTAGMWMTGETPIQQIEPSLRWLRDNLNARRWFAVGSAYLWPMSTARVCERFARELGIDITTTAFSPVGNEDFSDTLRLIDESGCDGVLQLQLGQDAVVFNRAFAAAGLDRDLIRFSPLMDETMLLASGPEATRNLYVTAGFFGSLVTEDAMDFGRDYFQAFGPSACPPTAVGESCMEGMLLLHALVGQAGSTDVCDLMATCEGAQYEGPRGPVTLNGAHTRQPMYLAVANGCDFDVIDSLPSTRAGA